MFEFILLTGLLAAALSQLLPDTPGKTGTRHSRKKQPAGHSKTSTRRTSFTSRHNDKGETAENTLRYAA